MTDKIDRTDPLAVLQQLQKEKDKLNQDLNEMWNRLKTELQSRYDKDPFYVEWCGGEIDIWHESGNVIVSARVAPQGFNSSPIRKHQIREKGRGIWGACTDLDMALKGIAAVAARYLLT